MATFNPIPQLGGANWSGNQSVATVRQLLSTSQGLENEISTIVVSGGASTWANYPAINNVNMAGYSLSNAANISTMNINVSSLNGATINVGGIVINNSTITNGGTTINGGNITNVNTTTSGDTKSKTYTVSDLVTSAGAAIDTITESVEALGGVFSAAEGAATIAQVAYGVGTIASGVQAANGVVDLTTKAASLFTTRTANTISGNAVPGQTTAVYETINGTTQFQFSTLNTATTTVFRTTDRTNPNQKFGNETFISTIIPAGRLCVRSVSDPLQFQMISSQLISTNNFLQSYGQWTQVLEPDNSINANNINAGTGTFNTSLQVNGTLNAGTTTLDALRVAGLFRVTNILGANVATIDAVGAITGTSLNTGGQVNAATGSYTGQVGAGSFLTAGNAQAATLTVTGAAGVFSLAATGAVTGNSLNIVNTATTGTLNVIATATAATVNATTVNAATVNAVQISTGNALISSINGVQFSTLINQPLPPYLSSLSLSTAQTFLSSINGVPIATILNPPTFSIPPFLSSFTVSTGAAFISSINGVSLTNILSPPAVSTVSTFQQLFTSSLVASNINTNGLQTNQLYTSSIQGNNISTGIGSIMKFNASSIQALDISTSTGYINQLNTSSIQVTGGLVFSTLSTVADISKSITVNGVTGYTNSILNYDFNAILPTEPTITIPYPQGGLYYFAWSQVGTWAGVINTFSSNVPGGSSKITIYLGIDVVVPPPPSGFIDIKNTTNITGMTVSGAVGTFGTVSIPLNSTYRFTWTYSPLVWSINTNPSPTTTTTYTNFNIKQNFAGVNISTSDILSLDATSIYLNAPYTQANFLFADTGYYSTLQTNFHSTGTIQADTVNVAGNLTANFTITPTISTTLITASNINTTILNSSNANINTISCATLFGSNIYTTNLFSRNTTCSTLNTSNAYNAVNQVNQKTYTGTVFYNALTSTFGTNAGGTVPPSQNIIGNQLNFYALPGLADFGIPPGYPVNTTLTFLANGQSLLNGNPAFPTPWYSSITSVDNSANGKIVNFQTPASGNGQVVMLTNGINAVSVQSNGVTAGIVTTIGYTKLTWASGVFTTQNVGTFSPYFSTLQTQTTGFGLGINSNINLAAQSLGFNSKLPVIFYQNFAGNFSGSPVGAASATGVLSLNGSNFPTNAWSCHLSFYNINLAQNNLAINNFNVTPTAIGSNWGAYCYTGTATVAGGATTGVNWNVQAMMVPKEFALSQNFNKYGDEPPEQPLPPSTFTSTMATFATLNLPDVFVSSMTAATINMKAIENISFNAGLDYPTFLGNGNIGINASTNVDVMANFDVNIGAAHDVAITATRKIALAAVETKIESGLLNMNNNNITNATTVSLKSGAAFTTNAATWTNGSVVTLAGDFPGGGKYIKWSYDNNPGTNIVDNNSITITSPGTNFNGNVGINGGHLYMNQNDIYSLTYLGMKNGGNLYAFNSGGTLNYFDINAPSAISGNPGILRLIGNSGGRIELWTNINIVADNTQSVTMQQSVLNNYVQCRNDGYIGISAVIGLTMENRNSGDLNIVQNGTGNMAIYAPTSQYLSVFQNGNNSLLQFQPGGNMLQQTHGSNYLTIRHATNASVFELHPNGGAYMTGQNDATVRAATGNVTIVGDNYVGLYGQSGSTVRVQPGGSILFYSAGGSNTMDMNSGGININTQASQTLNISQSGTSSRLTIAANGDTVLQADRTLYLIPGTDKVSVNGVLNVGSNLLMNGHDIIGASNINSTDLTMTGSNTLTLNANYMTFTGTSNFNTLGLNFGITGSNSVNITTPVLTATTSRLTMTDPVSGGSGSFTVDSGNHLYWNGVFIA
jgi:hypothetical protein